MLKTIKMRQVSKLPADDEERSGAGKHGLSRSVADSSVCRDRLMQLSHASAWLKPSRQDIVDVVDQYGLIRLQLQKHAFYVGDG